MISSSFCHLQPHRIMGAHETQQTDSEAAVGNKDEAIAIVGEEQHAIDPVVAARAVRKIDLFLIPAMIVGCM